MLKTSTIVACVLALSGSAALAQTYTNTPSGAGGAAPMRDVGSPSAMSTQDGYASQAQAPSGMQSGMQPDAMTNSRTPYITDEYGYQYNSRGDRIGRARR